jgi:Ribonuclease G/E
MRRILASCGPGEIRVAVMDGDTLLDYAIDRPGAPDGVGDLHVGRVAALVPAMAGAFVELAGAQAFLPDSHGAGLTEGRFLAVRVSRAAQGGKGPRLTARGCEALEVQGPARLLQRGPGALERIALALPDAPVWIDDAVVLARLRLGSGRARLVACAFDDALEAEVEALGEREIDLPGGLRASIVPTPALTAIDVDGGASTSQAGDKASSQLAANRAAIPALARQIRLRRLGGAILIDFAGMPMRKRALLGPGLEAALRDDPAGPRLLGFTGLGLAEILRPRIDPPLHELLAGPHAAGLAALRRAAREGASGARLTLQASSAIVSALHADTAALADLERRLTHPLMLMSDPALAPTQWTLRNA